jgi:hypothetical protein
MGRRALLGWVVVGVLAAGPALGQEPGAPILLPPADAVQIPEVPGLAPPLGEGAQAGPAAEKLTAITVNENFKIVVFGAIEGNLVLSSTRPVSPGSIFFLAPDEPWRGGQDTADLHARSSYLGAAITGPKLGEWQTGGFLMAYFYNDSVIHDRYGFLPYQLWGELKNDAWRVSAGLQLDVFNPVDPTMLNWPTLFASGAAGGASRGQLRVEHYVKPAADVQLTLQGALSEPITTIISDEFDRSEGAGWPNLEGRAALGLGPVEGAGLLAARPIEVGVSAVVGELRTYGVSAAVWGLGADARWKLAENYGVKGEVFVGQALGTYNGGVLQTVNHATGERIRTAGLWAEGYYYFTPCVHTHFGYGIDNPRDRDVAFAQRLRNQTYFGNILWDVTEHFRVGFETTYRETAYRGLRANDGVTFHGQLQWAF